jgi:hypothetical protein
VRMNALHQKMDIQFRAIMAAISESKAQTELINLRVISALSERVAVLEARTHRHRNSPSRRCARLRHRADE